MTPSRMTSMSTKLFSFLQYRGRGHSLVATSATLVLLMCLGGPVQAGPNDYPAVPLTELLTVEAQHNIGTDEMSPERAEALRRALLDAFRAGIVKGTVDASQGRPREDVGSSQSTQLQVDGEFAGWSGDTVVKLSNGQIWQQTERNLYAYHYAYRPKATLYVSADGAKLKVEGVDLAVDVKRLQ